VSIVSSLILFENSHNTLYFRMGGVIMLSEGYMRLFAPLLFCLKIAIVHYILG